jgi:hypothetical protein
MMNDDISDSHITQLMGSDVKIPLVSIKPAFLAAIDKAVEDGLYVEEASEEERKTW